MSEHKPRSSTPGRAGQGRSTSPAGPPPLPGRLPPLRSPAPAPAHDADDATLAAPPSPPAKGRQAPPERPALAADADPSLWPVPWLIAIVLIPLTAFFQQYTLYLGSVTLENAPEEVRTSEAAHPPDVSELVLGAKYYIKELHFEGDLDAISEDEEWAAALVADLEPSAVSRTQRLRLAIFAGEIQGAGAALERLDALAEEVQQAGALAADIAWLRVLYQDGPGALDDPARRSLIDRHGWFGELALSYNQPPHDPTRWDVISGYRAFFAFIIAAVLAWIGFFLLGVLAIVILIILVATRGLALHFRPPAPGGSVYLEMFSVFIGGFALVLSLFLFLFGLHAEGTTTALILMELVTWGLFLAVLYPVVIAKVPVRRALRDLGLHPGRGVFKEIACGFLGHIAGVPVIWLVSMILWIISMATSDGAQDTQGLDGYPIFNSPAGDTWIHVWISAASTVIWAPILEEIVFRGALYRHLRSRLTVPLSALISAAIFGLIHPYSTSGMIQVAFAGLVFAALREWRGSLIAPITAHALHNGTIMLVQIGVLKALE